MLICISVVVLYFYNSNADERNKEYYYLPQVKTYLKVYKSQFEENGNIVLGKDSLLTFSDKYDFIKVRKSKAGGVVIIINPSDNDKIYVYDKHDVVLEFNQVNLIIEEISGEDSTFIEEHIIAGLHAFHLKPTYIEISFDDFLHSVFSTNIIEEYPIEVKPLKIED